LRESSSQIEYSLWIFKPSIGYRYRYDASYNDNILKRGEKYNIYIGGLTITPTKRIVNSISYSIQLDDEFLDIWLRKDEARTIKEEISINDLPKGLDLNYQYTFREKKYKDITGTDSRQNLSYLKSSYDLGAFNLEYNHKYNRTRSALKLERFIKVEEGRGEYRFEDGEYIPDPFGEYIRIVEEAGDFRPVSEIDNTAIFRFDGRRLKNQEGTLKHIRVESNVEFNQRSEEIQIGFVDLINPWRDIDQSLIVNQRMNYIQDLYILSGNYKRKQEIRFRYNQDRNISAGGSYSGDYDDKRIGSFRLRKYLGSDFSLEAEYEREHRVVGGAARLKLDSDVVQPDISYTPSTAIEIGSGIKYRRDNETLDNYTVNLYSLLPHLRWNFSKKGRFDVNSEIIYVQSNDVEYFNFRIAEGNRKGNNYRLTVRGLLKLGEHSSGEVTYNLRKRPEEKTKHYARVQMKYSF
ncbi:MAG: hypothetical protein GY855_06100, partial [candidate division Zixibacteria bacterium]|nr:hypothetical protein [candidate division Zixibacteria bacterium]